MNAYYYRDNSGKEIGPFELDTLAKMRLGGILNGNTSIRSSDSTEWKPLNQILPLSSAPTVPQKSSKVALSWVLVGLLVLAMVGLIVWHWNSSLSRNPINAAQSPMDQIAASYQAQADKAVKENQQAKELVGTQQSTIEHAADAERDFRSETTSDNPGVKVVSFHAISGQPYYETNQLNSPTAERYKLNFEAEVEYEVSRTGGGITINPGDRITFSGTMIGTKTEVGGVLNSWQFKTHNLQIVGGSNPSLAAALKANLEKAKAISEMNACINNLRQIDGAINEWALETGKTTGAIPTWDDLKPYLFGGKIPSCPSGGTYTLHPVGSNPQVTCSIPGHALP